jgi:PAS domain S-box-containing protein
LLLDSVHDYAICMLSPTGEVTSWNAGAERLFANSTEEIIGRSVSAFYSDDDRALGRPADDLREAREHGRHEGECVRVRLGGRPFDAHVIMTPVQTNGELRGYSLVVRDITQRKQLEDDLRSRAEDLAAANRAKEDFLATLSHELRTPLNAMLGWTRLLRLGKLQGDGAERALETIERNARAQEQLIADILDMSRIVTGKLRLELSPCELRPVVDAALDAVRPAADAKGVELGSNIAWSGTVLGDSDRLQQVLWNLLVNGVKFTPAGGTVSIGLSCVGQIRSVPSGRQFRDTATWRSRSRPVNRPAHRRTPRRQGPGVECRAGARGDVLGLPADSIGARTCVGQRLIRGFAACFGSLAFLPCLLDFAFRLLYFGLSRFERLAGARESTFGLFRFACRPSGLELLAARNLFRRRDRFDHRFRWFPGALL